MLPPIGLQGFPFNETMGQIYGSSPVRRKSIYLGCLRPTMTSTRLQPIPTF